GSAWHLSVSTSLSVRPRLQGNPPPCGRAVVVTTHWWCHTGGPASHLTGQGHRCAYESGQPSRSAQMRLPQLANPVPSFGMYWVPSHTRLVPAMTSPLE